MDIEQITNHIDEKFGVFIDWTSKEAIPKLLQLIHKVAVINIIDCTIWFVTSIAVFVSVGIFTRYMFKTYYKYRDCPSKYKGFLFENNYGLEVTLVGIFVSVFVGVVLVIFAIILPVSISSLLRWIVTPEFEFLKQIMNGLK